MTVSRIFVFVFMILILGSCSPNKSNLVVLPPEGEFFDELKTYSLFSFKGNDLLPSEQLQEYHVINSLFTDYAEKDRWLYVPDGQTAKMNNDGSFDYPIGSMLVKNFYYSEAQIGEERLMETRLLIKDPKEWKAMSYVWDEEQKNAKISKVGDISKIEIQQAGQKREFDYVVPNKNQCKNCHNYDDKVDPLGFKFANLNMDILVDGTQKNQLEYFVENGTISDYNRISKGLSTMVAYEDESNDIQERALAYLDVNCGHCHRPNGPGNTSGLFLQYDEKRTNHLGFCKGPVAAGRGAGGRKFDIQPGEADSSILYFRMSSLDPGIMMPELGRSLTHTEGLQIVKDWINAIEYDCFSD